MLPTRNYELHIRLQKVSFWREPLTSESSSTGNRVFVVCSTMGDLSTSGGPALPDEPDTNGVTAMIVGDRVYIPSRLLDEADARMKRIRADARSRFVEKDHEIALLKQQINSQTVLTTLMKEQLDAKNKQLDAKNKQLDANNALVAQQLNHNNALVTQQLAVKDKQLAVKDEQLAVKDEQLTQSLDIIQRAIKFAEEGLGRAKSAKLKTRVLRSLSDSHESGKELKYVAPVYLNMREGKQVRLAVGKSVDEVRKIVGNNSIGGTAPIATSSPMAIEKLLNDRGNRLLKSISSPVRLFWFRSTDFFF
jgi:hypothetical protein